MLIPSKLSRPVRLQNTVIRDRLLAKLASAANYRLTLVNCPAGYGKTTLVAQWAAGKSDLGWYSLDESDNQPERFASYLIAALQLASGGHCVKSEALSQKHQYASLSALFAQLFIELSDWHQPLYLVIDDYHLITNDVIHEAMRFFLRHQPENLTLILLSRTLPPLVSPICACATSYWKWARNNWRLPIRKPNSSSTAAWSHQWSNKTAAACAMRSKVGPPRCS